MTSEGHSRRQFVKSGSIVSLGLLTAGCLGDDDTADDPEPDVETEADTVADAEFTAELEDDPDIPGHGEAGSDGTGEVVFEGTSDGTLEFDLEYQDLEGDVNGIHIHGDGAADGRYLVRLFEPEDAETADLAVETDEMLDAESGEISGTITDDHVNADGDYDDIETVEDLVAELDDLELGENGGVVNIHTEHDPDSELAGPVHDN